MWFPTTFGSSVNCGRGKLGTPFMAQRACQKLSSKDGEALLVMCQMIHDIILSWGIYCLIRFCHQKQIKYNASFYFLVVSLISAQWKASQSKCQKKKWHDFTHPARFTLSQLHALTEKERAQVVLSQVTLNLCCGSLLSTYFCALPVLFGLTSCRCMLCSSSRSPQEKRCGPQQSCL